MGNGVNYLCFFDKLITSLGHVMWIQWPSIPVWWQKKMYCSDMPSVVSAIDGTSHEIQIPSNEPQQKTYFQHTNSFHWLIWKESLYTVIIINSININNKFILTELEPSWSYGRWIYNYPCNHCLSPLKLWVWTTFMARCTR